MPNILWPDVFVRYAGLPAYFVSVVGLALTIATLVQLRRELKRPTESAREDRGDSKGQNR